MEPLKHECGVAMVRLLKPLSYYKEKYGTWHYGLNKLYLLMEKQHNRGQEAAGAGCIKMHSPAGSEYVYRERALGSGLPGICVSFGQHPVPVPLLSGGLRGVGASGKPCDLVCSG